MSRNTWTHRDVLRLAHPKTNAPDRAALFDWICGREVNTAEYDSLAVVEGFKRVNAEEDVTAAAKLVRDYRLPWEALPDRLINEQAIWEALLDTGIGITALIRQLPRLTRLGVIKDLGGHTAEIAAKISDSDILRKGRVHPMKMLDALLTYQSGRSFKGGSQWKPVGAIVDALDKGFYASFGAVTPTNKRILLALDVSGSMAGGYCAGSERLTPREGSAALALVTAAVEPNHAFVAFTSNGWQVNSNSRRGGWMESGITPLTISPRQRLDDVIAQTAALPMGGTDCALPMLYAAAEGLEVDAFITLTDNETWAGDIQVPQALAQYRKASGIQAKAITVAMTATKFSLADPTDPTGQLDVVGFSTDTPQVISTFIGE